jgi:hypothetical protein
MAQLADVASPQVARGGLLVVPLGAGVWTGALRARTTRPLRPTRARAAGLNATRPGG